MSHSVTPPGRLSPALPCSRFAHWPVSIYTAAAGTGAQLRLALPSQTCPVWERGREEGSNPGGLPINRHRFQGLMTHGSLFRWVPGDHTVMIRASARRHKALIPVKIQMSWESQLASQETPRDAKSKSGLRRL